MTTQEALLVGSATEVAVIVAVPAATPVTTPSATVAIVSAEVDQVTLVSSEPLTVATKVMVSPILTVAVS